MTLKTLLFTSLGLALTAAAPANESQSRADPVTEARALFERYVALEHAFDPTVVDLYAETAVIKNRRRYRSGKVRDMTLPGTPYKQILKAYLPIAKERLDRSTYSEVEYEIEGDGVRIKTMRTSEMTEHTSPLSILAKPDAGGTWLIHEEVSESIESQ